MTDTLPLSIQPVISYPKEAEVGKTYLMEIDLQMPESGFEWQYEEEEYLIYCMVNAGNLFTVTSVGEPAIMLHRFGGTYGNARFLLEADAEERDGSLSVVFVNQWGTPIRSVNCAVSLQKTPKISSSLINAMNAMSETKKTVLMSQLDVEQGKIWQAALESQQLEVVWESTDTDLVELLISKSQSATVLPDLLLIDTSLKSPNSKTLQSSSVCSWCSKNSPNLKIILFNPRQDKIRDIERGWAVRRGATDILPKLTQDNLTTSVARVTDSLSSVLNQEPLQAIALSLPVSNTPTEFSQKLLEESRAKVDGNYKTTKVPEDKNNEEDYFIYRGVKVKRV